jgi:sulfhydrogenase subunit beta (sulfur reductase)
MVDSGFPVCKIQDGLVEKLAAAVAKDRVVWSPRLGEDGVGRLQVVERDFFARAMTTRLPIKKLLFPHGDALWSYHDGQYREVVEPSGQAITGLPLCDLQALWYLDRVFSEDTIYLQRRAGIFVVGMLCDAGVECRCDSALMPIAGDLFIGNDRVWALSDAGLALLQAAGGRVKQKKDLPWPESPAAKRRQVTAEQLPVHLNAGVWSAEGERCLSCGACSAVCPTCYCFDLVDVAGTDGSVNRKRVWDNCFFAEHGRVAGGFDFRADRAARLRFRMEHKRLGFGDLRGQDSCVGCGRCRTVCPVDIDLDRIAEQLVTEAPDAG